MARRLRRRPGFSLVVIALLAGAVGLNATVFAVLNAVAFQRLPYPNADRLVDIRLAEGCDFCGRRTVPLPVFDAWKRSVRSVDRWAATSGFGGGLVLSDFKRELRGEAVTPGTIELLGGSMELGRSLLPEDDAPGAGARVILGAALWR